jgi:hypothetical protein
VAPGSHDVNLFAAVLKQVLDLAAVFRIVEHVRDRPGPPLAASSRWDLVAVKIGGSLERHAGGALEENPAHRLGDLDVRDYAVLLVALVAERGRAPGEAAAAGLCGDRGRSAR